MKLYEITEGYAALADMDLDDETLANTLESIDAAFEEKADSICHVLANIDSDVAALDEEVKRLQARKKLFSGRKERLKDYLRTQMQNSDKKKLETAKFTISRVAGRPTASITDEGSIPQQFQKVSVSIDKALLLSHLKDGEEIPGAELSTSKESLRIK